MKLLLYGINFHPELTGIGKYTGDMAAWLAARGHEVRVITAPPYYPAWKVSDGYHAARWHTEDWQGVRVWRCPLWVPGRPGGFTRLFHLTSFAVSSLPVALRQVAWRPDVVWVVAPSLLCAPAALAMARLSGARAWLHIQDFEVDAAFDMGLLQGAWLRRSVLAAERWLLRRFDRVSTISRRMLARLDTKGVAGARQVLFPNWVDVQALSADTEAVRGGAQAYRAQLGIPAMAPVALYSGNMGGKQGLELLVTVAQLCAERAAPVWFVFCGDGAGRDMLVSACRGLPQVRFMELQPEGQLPALLAMADVHLLPQRADAADLVMPSKLTGMLASGRPVVATANPGTELAEVVQCCGVATPPADAPAFAQAVLALAADSGLRSRLGAAGRAHALAHMDRSSVLVQFERELHTL